MIIPAWNEAAWLPSLLHRLRGEQVTEVIVADNNSDDATVEVATAHGCRVIRGGLPPRAKNAGAAAAIGDLLLFVDADVALTPPVMAAVLKEFRNASRSLVHFRLVPVTDRPFIKACYRVVDLYAHLGARLGAHQGSAPLICVRRDAFFAVGGFDEAVHAAEDVDFIRRVRRCAGGVIYIRHTPLLISARRFGIEPTWAYVVKCCLWALLRALGVRASIRPYKWIRYPEDVARQDAVTLASS